MFITIVKFCEVEVDPTVKKSNKKLTGRLPTLKSINYERLNR